MANNSSSWTIEKARANVQEHLTTMEDSYAKVKKGFDKEARANMEGYIDALRNVLRYLLADAEA